MNPANPTSRKLRGLTLVFIGAIAGLWSWAPAQTGGSNVAATKHNLTSSGPGPIRIAGAASVCIFCHTPHAANPIAPLWNRHDPGTYYQTYESTTLVARVGQPTGSSRLCLSCHDGTVAAKNVAADLVKTSVHPVTRTTGVHDPTENPGTMTVHVECVDCHNPHRSAGGAANAPFVRPSMKGASGLTGTGAIVPEAAYEYQVCYKCHSSRGTGRSPIVDRVLDNTNVADEFSPANPSFHPVEMKGRNTSVPSLVQPLLVTSVIYCTDCHGSDSTTVKGPHGSSVRPMLVRNYVTTDNSPESQTAYALCYGCHGKDHGPLSYGN